MPNSTNPDDISIKPQVDSIAPDETSEQLASPDETSEQPNPVDETTEQLTTPDETSEQLTSSVDEPPASPTYQSVDVLPPDADSSHQGMIPDISTKVTFDEMSAAVEKLRKILEGNPLVFGIEYFPHHFRRDSPKFHVKILVEAMKSRHFAVAAPRGTAKSTILAFLYPTHRICFKLARHIVILSSTEEKAGGTLATIKQEFKTNPRIIDEFGVTLVTDGKMEAVFEHPGGYQVRVLCKGRKQMGSVRGEKFGAYRPDLFIIDDLEDDESVKNPELREEVRAIFDNSIMKAGEEGVTQYVAIGTILHDDSLMARLVSPRHYKQFRKLRYQGRFEHNGEVYSIWPELWTVDRLNEMEKENPTSFAQEIQNDPTSGVLSQIKREDFRRWARAGDEYILYDKEGRATSRGSLKDCKAFISCDLAWDEKKKNDETVVMPAYFTPSSEVLVDNYYHRKGVKPNDIFEVVFPMEEKLRATTGGTVPIGFEKGKLEKVIKFLFRDEMKARNHFLLFKDLLWDADKMTRILTRLQPRYAQHTMYHLDGMGDLENQLVRIPTGAHDDLCDALSGICQLLGVPKRPKKEAEVEDPNFMWLRQQQINRHQPRRIVLGRSAKRGIPATEYFR